MYKKKQVLDCRKVYCSPFFESQYKPIKEPTLRVSEEINTKQRKHPNELQLEIPLSKKFKFQKG
jgi:hypothetical protein